MMYMNNFNVKNYFYHNNFKSNKKLKSIGEKMPSGNFKITFINNLLENLKQISRKYNYCIKLNKKN